MLPGLQSCMTAYVTNKPPFKRCLASNSLPCNPANGGVQANPACKTASTYYGNAWIIARDYYRVCNTASDGYNSCSVVWMCSPSRTTCRTHNFFKIPDACVCVGGRCDAAGHCIE